jgi:TPR repeat protein
MTEESDREVEVDPAIIERYRQGRAMFLAGDVDGSMKILKELAAAGVAQAQHTLGDFYLHPPAGGMPDPGTAIECFLAAAASDFPPAFSSLGRMYQTGTGVEKSVRKALDYYMEGARRSDLESIVLCAELLASGELGEPKHDLAIDAYWDAAQRGSPYAQMRLGIYYSEGKEVERDLELAAELYKAAAEQGNEYAAYNLGQAYENGNSAVSRDLAEAIRWYQVAADAGVIAGQHNLAACHAHPDNPDRDLEVAAMWFHKAAEGGAKTSMECLARIYALGEGVNVDLEKAAYWSNRAAAAMDLDSVTGRVAASPLGDTEAGQNVARDPSAAVQTPGDDAAFTEEEERQLIDMTNRIRAIMRELEGEGWHYAFVVANLLAELLTPHDEELREAVLEYVVEEARDRVPLNERLLEQAWRKEPH